MWLPAKIVDWCGLNAELVRNLQAELAVSRAECAAAKLQLGITQSNFSWLTNQVNALQAERAQLLEKAYNIRVPVPEIMRTATSPRLPAITDELFEDMGDEMATKLGIPSYTS